MRSPGLKSRVMFEGRRRESQDQKGEQRSSDREMRARTRAGTVGPAGGGGCLGVSRRACEGQQGGRLKRKPQGGAAGRRAGGGEAAEGGGGAACAPPQSAASSPSSARACGRRHLRQGCCPALGRQSPTPSFAGLFPRAAAHEGGARRERREAASAAARFPPAPSGGGAALTCRAATLGLWGALAASAHVHAGHLRHQLPQRRLNGSELQPPPPLPPPSLRRSRAAPARRPLALGRTNCSPRWGWHRDRRGSWLGS